MSTRLATATAVVAGSAIAIAGVACWIGWRFDADLRQARAASPSGRARVHAMVDHILPVSTRAAGLRSDTAAGRHLAPAALEALQLSTLVVSARDDRHGTYASAAYTASRVPGARFLGFDQGGHTWVGHDDAVMAGIALLLSGRPDVFMPPRRPALQPTR